jgi:tRNA-Thr(GGU) m(6)t(6)A37 methyltransferase TsaA
VLAIRVAPGELVPGIEPAVDREQRLETLGDRVRIVDEALGVADEGGEGGRGHVLHDAFGTCAIPGPSIASCNVAIELTTIGEVESPLTDPALAPKQGDEGAPEAWLVFRTEVLDGLDSLEAGDQVIVLTWLDRARRDVLRVHPRDDPSKPLRGVFNTRSADRPNPIGLHVVKIVAIDGHRLRVRNLEAVNATPILDIKPVLKTGR